MNSVFSSLLTPNITMLFMGLFLVITLKNADGITPKTVQQKQFCWGQCDALQVSVFQLLWRDPGIGVRNSGRVNELLILQAILSEECCFSERLSNKYFMVWSSNCPSVLDLNGGTLVGL